MACMLAPKPLMYFLLCHNVTIETMAVIGSRQLRHFIGSRNTGKVYVVSRSRGVLSSGVKRIRQISCSSAGLAAGDPPPSSGSGRTQEKPQSIPQSSASPPSSSNSGSFNASNHDSPITSASSGFQLSIVHVALFTTIFVCGAFFATLTLQASTLLVSHVNHTHLNSDCV